MGLGKEVLPRLAGSIDDGFVAVEDPVGEPVGAQELPDVLDRVELRRARGQKDRRDVLGYLEPCGCVPSGTVEQEHGVCASGDMATDLVEVKLHGFGVGEGQRECCTGSARRADGAEEVGTLVALVGRLAGPRATTCPLPHEAVLLPDAGFILEPYLDRLCLRQASEMGAQRVRKVFLYASTMAPSCPG